jgi:hypothetical protein
MGKDENERGKSKKERGSAGIGGKMRARPGMKGKGREIGGEVRKEEWGSRGEEKRTRKEKR